LLYVIIIGRGGKKMSRKTLENGIDELNNMLNEIRTVLKRIDHLEKRSFRIYVDQQYINNLIDDNKIKHNVKIELFKKLKVLNNNFMELAETLNVDLDNHFFDKEV
jgi:hypothetical protein